eukprot:8657589-Pyramimonas_sp.AAC.1
MGGPGKDYTSKWRRECTSNGLIESGSNSTVVYNDDKAAAGDDDDDDDDAAAAAAADDEQKPLRRPLCQSQHACWT